MQSVLETAKELGVSRRRVYALIEAGALQAEKVGGIWLVDEASVEKRKAHVNPKGGRPKRGSHPDESTLVLMNRTHEVATLVYDSAASQFTHILDLIDPNRLPMGVSMGSSKGTSTARRRLSLARLNAWWRDRGIPDGRRGLATILEDEGVRVPQELIMRNLGASLSDQYWVKPAESQLSWEHVNFFTNDFNVLDVPPDYLGKRHPDNTSDGLLPKHWIIREGTRVLLKEGVHDAQEPCNEAIATKLHERLLPSSDYVPYALGEWNGRLASSCACFIDDDEEFVPAWYASRTLEQPEHLGDYQHFLNCCEKLKVKDAERLLSEMIVCDDILANTDRHWRNFGLIRNVETLECRMAPIFDSGTSLWCTNGMGKLRQRDFGFEAKPFHTHPGKQLQLADLDWVDTRSLDGLSDMAREILHRSALDEERIDLICKGIDWRIERMTNICEYL